MGLLDVHRLETDGRIGPEMTIRQVPHVFNVVQDRERGGLGMASSQAWISSRSSGVIRRSTSTTLGEHDDDASGDVRCDRRIVRPRLELLLGDMQREDEDLQVG